METSPAPHPRERFVHRDPREPRREARLSAEFREVLEGSNVGVLHHVLGLVIVAGDGARRAKDANVVAPHERFERASISSDDARDDLLVADRGCGDGLMGFHGHGGRSVPFPRGKARRAIASRDAASLEK